MLNSTYFFHNIIRRYTIALGSLFTNIYVRRTDPYAVVETQSIKVPLHQSSKKKFYMQLMQYANKVNDPFSILLPRISYYMTSMDFDTSRKKNSKNSYRTMDSSVTDSNKMIKFFEPSPWNFHFSMTVWAINESDNNQIIEQILPYFEPHCFISVNEMPTLGISRSVSVELTGVNRNLNLDSGEDTNDRTIQWDLSFTMKGFLYKANVEADIIKRTIVKIRDLDAEDAYDPYTWWEQELEVTPWDSEEDDEWDLTQTIIEDGVTKTSTINP